MSSPDVCPNCHIDLQGSLIYETFLEQYNDPVKALETASLYGATETTGRWGKAIGISCMDRDRVISWQCPECNHRWDR